MHRAKFETYNVKMTLLLVSLDRGIAKALDSKWTHKKQPAVIAYHRML